MPIPFPADHAYAKLLDTTNGPDNKYDQKTLQQDMKLHYRQAAGLLIWPMVKCHPDYSFHITKLSQVLSNPARPHYEAI
jgi:hypothetical protein